MPHRLLVAAVALVGIVAAMGSCVAGQTAPEPAISSLVVRNRSFFDVDVYALRAASGMPVRLGTVVGSSTAIFMLRSRDLQPGGLLVVRLHAIGTRGSWTSDAVSIGQGVRAMLDVNANAFGDYSASSLYTVVTTGTALRLRR